MFRKMYVSLGKYPAIGLFVWMIGFSLGSMGGVVEIVSLIVGTIVGLLTIVSKIQTFLDKRERRRLRGEIRTVLEENGNHLTPESAKTLERLLNELED